MSMITNFFPQPQRMASVWKRLQRVNKRAAKFQYTASYHRIDLETSVKWKPNKLSVVWTRRSRRVVTEPQEWEPSLKDPLKGAVQFTLPENHTVAVTLFKDSRTNELEDKDWTFVLEDVSSTGKRRRVAVCSINMRRHASLEPSQRSLVLTLEPTTHKIRAASIQLTLHCVLLREGHATDEDMQSLASLLSVNNNSDIAVLEELDEDDYTDNSTKHMLDFRQQMEEMTQSLTNSDVAATPNSVQSLAFDPRTPTASTPHHPHGPPHPHNPADLTPVNAPDNPFDMDEGDDKQEEKEYRDLKITEEKDRPKSRPEFLSNLTKLAMGNAPPRAPPSAPKQPAAPTNCEPGIKGLTFKTSAVVKRNLKPLELKTNLNNISLDNNDNEREGEGGDNTPTGDTRRHRARDKTPVQDLLEWCQGVTREYPSVKVTNLTTSFRSGLAFCAIIHRYRPDLIDFSGLQPDAAEHNVRAALDASGTLGISQVLTAADVCSRPTPDKLAIMTYLFQLRAHFTGNELQVEQLGNDETESSYLVGRHTTDDSLPPELFSREVSSRRSRNMDSRPRPVSQGSQDSRTSQDRSPPEKASPTGVRDSFLHQSKTILNKVLSPPASRDRPTAKWFTDHNKGQQPPPKPVRLMTRKELTDPFGSDEEEEPTPGNGTQSNAQDNNTDLLKDKSNGTQSNAENTSIKDAQSNETQESDTELFEFEHIQPESNIPESNAEQKKVTQCNVSEDETAKEDHSAPTSPLTDPLGVAQLSPAPPQTPPQDQPPTPAPAPAPALDLPKPTPQLLSRHDELKERARLLLEQTKKEAREKARKQKEKEDNMKIEAMNGVKNGDLSPSKKPLTEEERQAILRERARKLIADARAGVISPTSPLSPNRVPRGGTVEIISKQSVMEEIAAAGGLEQMDGILCRAASEHSGPPSRKSSLSPDRTDERISEDTRSIKSNTSASPPRLQSFSDIIERLTPDKENIDEGEEKGSYIQSELEALEREQCAIDEKAAALEKQLRRVMEDKDNTEEEDKLMSQWFNLVNKKNALLRRQMQLNILEQEEDLSRRCELLARELRLSLGVEEWRKTGGQKRRERLLLQELLSAVNERDRLVQEMDEQEKAIAEDAEIEHNLSQVEIQRKNNCILQ